MKTEILNQPKEFQPIEIKITLESQEEVDLMFDIGNISAEHTVNLLNEHGSFTHSVGVTEKSFFTLYKCLENHVTI